MGKNKIAVSKYHALKRELDTVENDLKNCKNTSYELYNHLKKKQELLQKEIERCPLIYEIWYDDYDGSMTMRESKHTLVERYLDKTKAYRRLDELNDACNYGSPYYIRVEELDG